MTNSITNILALCLKALTQTHTRTTTPASAEEAMPGSIIPAKCSKHQTSFGIVLGIANGQLSACYGVEASKHIKSGEKLCKNFLFTKGIKRSQTYKCPICGNKNFVQCRICGNISCFDNSGWFHCAHCGNRGIVSGRIYQTQGFKCVHSRETADSTQANNRFSVQTIPTANTAFSSDSR